MYENNAKGTENMPYYMEYANDSVVLDYSKAFDI